MTFHVVHIPIAKPITSRYLKLDETNGRRPLDAKFLAQQIDARYIEQVRLSPRVFSEEHPSGHEPIMLVDEEAKLSSEPKEYNLMASFLHSGNLTTAPILGEAIIVWAEGENFVTMPDRYKAGFWRKQLQDLL